MSTITFETSGSLAKRLGVSIFRVIYLLRTRKIEPVGRAGNIRLYDASAVDQLKTEILKAKKRGVS